MIRRFEALAANLPTEPLDLGPSRYGLLFACDGDDTVYDQRRLTRDQPNPLLPTEP